MTTIPFLLLLYLAGSVSTGQVSMNKNTAHCAPLAGTPTAGAWSTNYLDCTLLQRPDGSILSLGEFCLETARLCQTPMGDFLVGGDYGSSAVIALPQESYLETNGQVWAVLLATKEVLIVASVIVPAT